MRIPVRALRALDDVARVLGVADARGSGRARGLLVVALAALALAAPPAAAEHEIYYRFTVVGYVKDTHGKPVVNATVEVIRDKTDFKYLGETDETGLYVVRVRLGDESRGETLTVRQGARVRRVIAIFDPANVTDERGTRVDFEGTHSVERAARFQSTLQSAIGAVSAH